MEYLIDRIIGICESYGYEKKIIDNSPVWIIYGLDDHILYTYWIKDFIIKNRKNYKNSDEQIENLFHEHIPQLLKMPHMVIAKRNYKLLQIIQ